MVAAEEFLESKANNKIVKKNIFFIFKYLMSKLYKLPL